MTLNEKSLRQFYIDTDFDKPVMQEEIFGPLLPIISYRSLDKAIQTLKTKEKTSRLLCIYK